MNLVEQTLLRLGGHVANISYQRFLHVMDLILQQDVFPSGQLMSKIYSQAARDLDVSRDVLVRSVARVVDDMWYNGNPKILKEILEEKPEYKPYPKDMLHYLYRYVQKKEKEQPAELVKV